jgi:uncharacterized membrane protein YhiD involved in acid resistance
LNNLLLNWKTTSAGLAMIVGGVIHLIYALKNGGLTEADCTTTVLAIVTGIGFIAAGDANVPPPPLPPK